jgi:hypothetical protein
MKVEKFEIAIVAANRERACAGYQASATYIFAITDGFLKARAEVMLADGCLEIIERKSKNSKLAARLALEQLLDEGCDPFQTAIFLRIPYRHAEYFSKHGSFHHSLH